MSATTTTPTAPASRCPITPAQRRVLECRAPEQIVFGGLGSAKTATIPMGAYQESVMYPKNLGCIATANHVMLRRAIVYPLTDWLEKYHIAHEYKERWQRVDLPNGSRWEYQTMDVPWQELKGPEYGFVFIDEADTVDEQRYETLIGRARRQGTAKIARAFCNPPPAGHWLERRVHDGLCVHTTLSSYDNPFLPREVLARYERMYPKGTPRHARWLLGKLGVPLEGAVYPEFDIDLHIVERAPPFVGYVAGLDFGYVNPTAMLIAGITSDDALYIIGEYYAGQRLIRDHARDMLAMRAPYGRVLTFADHDAQDRAEYEQCGIETMPAPMGKDVTAGCDMVRRRLVDGKLFILKGAAPNLIRELGQYVYAKSGAANAKEQPIKLDDHTVDSLRYLVTGLDHGALEAKNNEYDNMARALA